MEWKKSIAISFTELGILLALIYWASIFNEILGWLVCIIGLFLYAFDKEVYNYLKRKFQERKKNV